MSWVPWQAGTSLSRTWKVENPVPARISEPEFRMSIMTIVRAYKAESELVNGVMRDVGVCSAAVAMIVGKILRVNRVLWQAEKRVFVWLAGGSDPYGCC